MGSWAVGSVEATWGAGQGQESPLVPRTLAVFWLASQEVKQKRATYKLEL